MFHNFQRCFLNVKLNIVVNTHIKQEAFQVYCSRQNSFKNDIGSIIFANVKENQYN